MESRSLPGVRLVAGGCRSRRRAPRHAVLVLRRRLGAHDLRVHLLRRERREIRYRRARPSAQRSAGRTLQRLRRLLEDDRSAGTVAVSAAVDLGYRDNRSRCRCDGTPVRTSTAERSRAQELTGENAEHAEIFLKGKKFAISAFSAVKSRADNLQVRAGFLLDVL